MSFEFSVPFLNVPVKRSVDNVKSTAKSVMVRVLFIYFFFKKQSLQMNLIVKGTITIILHATIGKHWLIVVTTFFVIATVVGAKVVVAKKLCQTI